MLFFSKFKLIHSLFLEMKVRSFGLKNSLATQGSFEQGPSSVNKTE